MPCFFNTNKPNYKQLKLTTMRNLGYLATLACLLIVSCGKINEEESNLIVGGSKTLLRYGVIEDNGTDTKITYRVYDFEFRSSETNPSAYIKFRLYTPTSGITLGTYTYDYYAEKKGTFSYVTVAYGLRYDSKNVVIEGNVLTDSDYTMSGTIVIGRNSDTEHYTFDINLELKDKENRIETIKSHFEKVLNEGSVLLY